MVVDSPDRRRLLGVVFAVLLLVGAVGSLVVAVGDGRIGDLPSRQSTAPDGPAQIERLHEEGATGDGVSVGVLVATGVDRDRLPPGTRVASARSFAPDETVENGGQARHGTATAAVVARTAPDAELYLASFDTAAEFEEAAEWLRRERVDVVVAPVSFYGRPGDGSSRVARSVDRLARDGSVAVVPAGNVGQGHWSGAFDPTDAGVHRFSGGTRNYLRSNGGRRLTVWLSWNESGSDAEAGDGPGRRNFTFAVYRQTGETARLVGRSRPFTGDETPNAWLTARVDPGGTYYVEVRGPADATEARLELSSPTHAFQYRERGGSLVAPATARGALAVGAADPQTGEVRPYSSAGPIGGDRPGVDVVASDDPPSPVVGGDFGGTSAATAYTAGVVALVLDANPDLSQKEVEAVLEVTASEAGPDGVDPVAGHGRVVPERAVDRARNVSA